jgi:hypothetical protein
VVLGDLLIVWIYQLYRLKNPRNAERARAKENPLAAWLLAGPGGIYGLPAASSAEPGGLVLDVDSDLGQSLGVLPVVMRAEQQLRVTLEYDTDIGLGAAPVTQVHGVERLGWG